MARQQGIKSQNNFVGGLITETTALRFPENACFETSNVVFDFTGTVSRRKGFEFETGYSLNSITPAEGDVYTEFFWTAAAGNGAINLLVQQQGSTIHFFDLSNDNVVSPNKKNFTVDLTTYVPSGSTANPAFRECQYAVSRGNLVVVNSACDPIYIIYSVAGDSISVASITIYQRDLIGLNDGLDLTERPSYAAVSDLVSGNPEHYYNILNQGWFTGDALTQWDTVRTDMPSNADVTLLFRASETDAFDNNKVTARNAGNTPAPKGHFILEATHPDRSAALTAEGYSTVTFSASSTLISPGLGSIIGDHSNSAAAFDGNTAGDWATPSTVTKKNGAGGIDTSYIGKNFSSLPQNILSAKIYAAANGGIVSGANPSMTIDLYGKNGSAPASGTDGTILGTTSFVDGSVAATHTIVSSDSDTIWDYVWIYISNAHGAGTYNPGVAELEFFTPTASDEVPNTTERFKSVASYTGRLFYAGVDALGLNTYIWFTQILERTDQYGKCYQKQDPTSEDFADLNPDDGGVIVIPEIGSIYKLFTYQSSLLVLANNGVWRISGSTGSSFKANDYQIKKLTSIGVNNAQACVDFGGIPLWWAEDGIYTAAYNANYDSFDVQNLTLTTIATFFDSIPANNRPYVKGHYDYYNKVVYWLYNDDADSTDKYSYNNVLCLDGVTKAFYPWTISDLTDGYVRGICFISDGSKIKQSLMKYTVQINDDLTYAECYDDGLQDWTITTGGTDYRSYFITGHSVDGQGQKFFQTNYVFVYLNQIEDSSCYLQAHWDFASSGSSGKYSSRQELYNPSLANRFVNMRRLKVRGKGRAVQFLFESNTNKPFEIIGWSIQESVNAGI